MLRRTLIGLVIVTAAWMAWALLTLPPGALTLPGLPRQPDGLTVMRGVYHVHTRASDGTGTVEEVAAAADRSGLAFVIVTDHGDAFRDPAPPRYYGRVLCIDATEISTTDGHYTALGLGRPPYPLAGEGRDVIEDVRRLGGFGSVAHPDSPRDALRWNEWDAQADGIEWLNADSAWREFPAWQWFPALVRYAARPVASIAAGLRRPDSVLERWDQLAQRHPIVALAASDAHARFGFRRRPDPYEDNLYLKLPSYAAVFSTFSLNVELDRPPRGDAAADARALLSAIRSGAVYTTIDGLARPGQLTFTAVSGSAAARQGAALPLDRAVLIRAAANVPPGGALVLIRNGEIVEQVDGGALRHATDRPGVYRVEAWLPHAPGTRPVPWILSNPIYVGLRPVEPAIDTATSGLALQPFPITAAWHVESDTSSRGAEHTLEGSPGERVQELTFQLGHGAASPFVALSTRTVEAVRSASSLAFVMSASRPMRVSVQVRLDSGDSNLRWVRSVYADTMPRQVRVDLKDMRVAGSGAREGFDQARIQSLLFVVDTVNARPGDSGTIRIGELQVGTPAASRPHGQ